MRVRVKIFKMFPLLYLKVRVRVRVRVRDRGIALKNG